MIDVSNGRKHDIKKIALVLCFIIFVYNNTLVQGQEMFGTTLGNYSGVNGIQLNPSTMNSSKSYLDINILSGDIFVENNYLYQSRTDYRFNHFFQSGYEIPSHQEDFGTAERMFYWNNSHTGKDAYISVRINGPGAMLVRGRHAFAISTALRTVTSASNLPYDIANFIYLGLNYRPQHNINYKENRPFRMAEMTWAEIGLSYSYQLYQHNYNELAVGISVKRLMGYAGAYGYVKNMDYIVPDDSTIIINNVNAEMGFSLPISYGDETAMWNDKLIKGGGFGFDVGLTYTRLKRLHQNNPFTTLCAQQPEPYEYRLGIALIDAGAIRFKENAIKTRIENKSSVWEDIDDYEFHGITQLFDTLSYRFYGDNTSAQAGTSFYLYLPTALSMQFDYSFTGNLYLNGSFIYGVPLSHASLTRPALLSVTPRYESHWFEANLPISLYDWYLPRVGLSMRFWWLTVGTEKLGQFFNMRNFSGMDVYFGIKFFFDKGNCRNVRQKGCADMDYKISSR